MNPARPSFLIPASLLAIAPLLSQPRAFADPQTGASTIIGSFSHPFVASLTWDSSSRVLYATTSDANTSLLLRVNPETGATTSVGPLGSFFMHGIEYNPIDDTLYGVAIGPAGQRLYRINRATGAATLIAPINVTGLIDIALDPTSGVMYLSEVNEQRLRTLNLTNGATTIVGSFGAPGMPFPRVGVGMAFDPNLGLFASDNTGFPGNPNPLYRIDTAPPTPGHATLVGLMSGTNMLGLAFIPGDCPADFNADAAVNSQDFFDFLTAFFAEAPGADFNRDTLINSQDFFDFLAAFFVGC
jgi:hypothetical protein